MLNQKLSKMYILIKPFRSSVGQNVADLNLVCDRDICQELICFSIVQFFHLVQRIRILEFLREWCLCFEADVPCTTLTSERNIVLFNQHSNVVLHSLFIYMVIPSFAL